MKTPPSPTAPPKTRSHRRGRKSTSYPTVFAFFFTIVTLTLFGVLSLKNIHTAKWTSKNSKSSGGRTLSITNRLDPSTISSFSRLISDSSSQSSCTSSSSSSYESCSCDEIFNLANFTSQACIFAHTCDGGEGIGFFARFFCTSSSFAVLGMNSVLLKATLLLPFLCIYLALLFRMLASTAEDFFSPALEMLCHKMHFPPRFAGVTLLALGNGAADVSSTITSISANIMDASLSFQTDPDASPGYQLSLGGLTGSGMMSSTIVLGYVIYTARGISCRAAFVRDVSVFLLTNVLLFYQLHPHPLLRHLSPSTWFSSSSTDDTTFTKTTTPATVDTFTIRFWVFFYFSFVSIVLIADIYHRTVVLPRWKSKSEALEQQRQDKEEYHAKEHIGQAMDTVAYTHTEAPSVSSLPQPIKTTTSPSITTTATTMQSPPSTQIIKNPSSLPDRALNAILKAMSNYDDSDKSAIMNSPRHHRLDFDSPTSVSSSSPTRLATLQADRSGWGYALDGRDLEIERPVILRGNSGILTRHPHPHHQPHKTFSFSSTSSIISQQPQLHQQMNTEPTLSQLSDEHPIYSSTQYSIEPPPRSSSHTYTYPKYTSSEPTSYFVPMMIDRTIPIDISSHYYHMIDFPLCTAAEFRGRGNTSYSWWGSFMDGKNELIEHFTEIWIGILEDDEDDEEASDDSSSYIHITVTTFLSKVDKVLLILEYPITTLRKVCLCMYIMFFVRFFCCCGRISFTAPFDIPLYPLCGIICSLLYRFLVMEVTAKL